MIHLCLTLPNFSFFSICKSINNKRSNFVFIKDFVADNCRTAKGIKIIPASCEQSRYCTEQIPNSVQLTVQSEMNTGEKNEEASPKTAFENPVHTPLFCSKDQFQAGGTYWNPYVQMSSSKLTVTELGKPKKNVDIYGHS